MKFRLFLLLTSIGFLVSVQARLGWTLKQMEENYGEGLLNVKGEIEYKKNDIVVCVLYHTNRVVFIRYEGREYPAAETIIFLGGENRYRGFTTVTTYEKRRLADEQIKEFMEINGRGRKWLFRGRHRGQERGAEMGFETEEGNVQEYVLDGGQARAFHANQRTKLAFVMNEFIRKLGEIRKANIDKDIEQTGGAVGF